MLINWNEYLSASPEIPSEVMSQFLWYNNYIAIEDAVINFEKSSNKDFNFVSQVIGKWQDHSMSQSQRLIRILEWYFFFSGLS